MQLGIQLPGHGGVLGLPPQLVQGQAPPAVDPPAAQAGQEDAGGQILWDDHSLSQGEKEKDRKVSGKEEYFFLSIGLSFSLFLSRPKQKSPKFSRKVTMEKRRINLRGRKKIICGP